MTLYRQLIAGISLTVLIVLAGVQAIYLRNAHTYLQQQLQSHAQDAATALGLSLPAALAAGDLVLAETIVSASFDRGHYSAIELRSAAGEVLLRKQLEPGLGEVPGWFARLFPLRAPTRESLMSSGWRQLGRVIVTSHPVFAYRQLWATTLESLGWMAIIYVLALLGMHRFLRGILQPLAEIEQVAAAIGNRDFRTIAARPRARELQSVVTTINRLSATVKRAIEEESTRAERLREELYRDALTGLFNRQGFEQQAAALLAVEREVLSGALALLEFNDFARFNKDRGFAQGDELLVLGARAVVMTCQNRQAVASRWAGGTFALVVSGVTIAETSQIAASLSSNLESILREQGLSDQVTFNCGIAHFDGGAPPLKALLGRADMALAGAHGRAANAYALAEPAAEDGKDIGSLAWRNLLEATLDSGRVTLYAQAAFSIATRAPLHREVMARLLDEEGTVLSAARFLPMASRHGLMPRLDSVVLERIVERLKRRPEGIPMAVNLSAHAIRDEAFLAKLRTLLGPDRQLAGSLVFELTEFGVLQDLEATVRFAALVRRLGSGFAVDQFGMHRDSFRYLQRLLPDYIKLAAARDLGSSAENRFYVESIVRIARSLEIDVMAQAVEDESLLPLLAGLGFSGFQGYAGEAPSLLTD